MENDTPLGFEDLQVGARWVSEARVITASDIQQFADLTGDQDPLHTDPIFAANGPFGKPIAHGLLGVSIMAGLSSQAPAVRTSAFLGIRSWSFLKPVYAGDQIHAITEVIDLKEHGRRHGEVHWYRQLINQDGQKVQDGILITLVVRSRPLSLQRDRLKEGKTVDSIPNSESITAY